MVNLKDIPKYLKENAKFCNWKYETRNGRLTKVPYNPPTNNKASVNNANTFTDFNSIVNGLDIYDGIGIRVDGKIIAIDLDHCIEDGNLCSWSEEIVSHFPNTYIEISPSCTGFCIILLPPDNYLFNKDKYYIKKIMWKFM